MKYKTDCLYISSRLAEVITYEAKSSLSLSLGISFNSLWINGWFSLLYLAFVMAKEAVSFVAQNGRESGEDN